MGLPTQGREALLGQGRMPQRRSSGSLARVRVVLGRLLTCIAMARSSSRLVAFALATALLAGCGGDSTTIIQTTGPTSSTTSTTTTAKDPPAPGSYFTHEIYCGEVDDPYGTAGIWVEGGECDEVAPVAREADTNGAPRPWGCAAEVLACENSKTSAKFLVAPLTCKPPTVRTPNGTCEQPPPVKCSKSGVPITDVTPQQPGASAVSAVGVDCSYARAVATQYVECYPHCGAIQGYLCEFNRYANEVTCSDRQRRQVTFDLIFFDV